MVLWDGRGDDMTISWSWSQPSCAACFEARNPGRQPVRMLRAAERETCVYCENPTYDGIYIRIDPAIASHPSLTKEH